MKLIFFSVFEYEYLEMLVKYKAIKIDPEL